jgi:hypothetical protein
MFNKERTMDRAQQLIKATELRNAAARADAAAHDVLTLAEAKLMSKAGQHASISGQCARWYAQGYYMRSNGKWYGAHGGFEFPKYSTA